MSQYETLMARDGHEFSAYFARPAGNARGGVVIVQEIFGVTAHIRAVADSYARDGYLAVVPALFDRVGRDLVLGYTPDQVQQGMGYRQQVEDSAAVLDISAAAAVAGHVGKVAAIGFCWGGRLAWRTAQQGGLDATVCYYGGGIANVLDPAPRCPTLLHFGADDTSIPMEQVDRIRAACPAAQIHVYAHAGHAFNNTDRPQNFNAAAAALARTRTDAFLAQHLKP